MGWISWGARVELRFPHFGIGTTQPPAIESEASADRTSRRSGSTSSHPASSAQGTATTTAQLTNASLATENETDAFGQQVSSFVANLLSGNTTDTGIGAAISEFVTANNPGADNRPDHAGPPENKTDTGEQGPPENETDTGQGPPDDKGNDGSGPPDNKGSGGGPPDDTGNNGNGNGPPDDGDDGAETEEDS